VEARTRLALDRGDAVGDQPAHAGAGRGVEPLLRKEPRALHQVADAAARRLEIPALAALAQHLEIHQALLAVDDVGVRIDQARRDDLACKVAHRGGRRRLSGRSDPGDLSVRDAERAVAYQSERTIVGHGGDSRIGQKQLEHTPTLARPCWPSTDAILSVVGETAPMPLKWEIFHDQKLVHIVAQGQVTLPEMEEHFDALAVADVLQYGKLFDATAADPIYTDQDVMAMGARLSAYTATLKSGPLAVIGLSEKGRSAFRRFFHIC